MDKVIINSENAPAPIGPYNQAVLVNGMLFASGQIAIDPETSEFIQADIQTETKKVMQNIGAVLQEAGMTYANIVKTSIFLLDMNDFGKVNEVYGTYFPDNAPARETVEVSRLPKDAHVEISIIAVK